MKIRCVHVPDVGADMIPHPLNVGKVYTVLAMYVRVGGETKFRILTNESIVGPESVAVFDGSMFEAVDQVRASNWTDKAFGDMIESAPAAWQTEGFWENFYDGDLHSQRIFESEYQLMLSEDR